MDTHYSLKIFFRNLTSFFSEWYIKSWYEKKNETVCLSIEFSFFSRNTIIGNYTNRVIYIVSNVCVISPTCIIKVDKQLRRPSSRSRQSSKVLTSIFNAVKFEDLQLVDDKSEVHSVDRWLSSQKFNLISCLHKDKIKANVVERFSGNVGVVVIFLTSTVRHVIYSVRSLRIVLSSVHRQKKTRKMCLLTYV